LQFEFFLKTDDDWCGTFDGGYVKVIISNELSPAHDVIRIGFWGTDDFAMITDSGKKDPAFALIDMSEAMVIVQQLPKPISIGTLKDLGFEPF
jgi:hypothetical protein